MDGPECAAGKAGVGTRSTQMGSVVPWLGARTLFVKALIHTVSTSARRASNRVTVANCSRNRHREVNTMTLPK